MTVRLRLLPVPLLLLLWHLLLRSGLRLYIARPLLRHGLPQSDWCADLCPSHRATPDERITLTRNPSQP
jgi:hypothetical protein